MLKEDLRHKRAPGLLAAAQALALGEAQEASAQQVYLTPARSIYAECLSLIHI